jgi:hypothetical protein
LLDPITRRVLRDGGTTTTHTAPSLLHQLRAAGGTSGEGGGGGRGSRNPIPIDPVAVDLLIAINMGAIDLHDRALEHSKPTIENRVRAVVELAEHWDDPAAIEWATGWLRHWRKSIEDTLDPPRRYHLDAPCPACGSRMAARVDNDEIVQVPALLLDSRLGATCQVEACGAHWTPDQFEHLARVIREQAGASLAETG